MKFLAIILSIAIFFSVAAADVAVPQNKACYCISQTLGGLCIQWGGGPACQSAIMFLWKKDERINKRFRTQETSY
ncbi:hypothetical protein BpHYR1_002534 [Brachionus plicatilis]|uniref:Uncharacterized protein n=1 Tax=Brachionus plicatilis TaxID=10195 RepID=A0A3M7SQL6_BRAPC|nr:hypothetical protein BpHYR1_002534 [Brachionus plicatilis]